MDIWVVFHLLLFRVLPRIHFIFIISHIYQCICRISFISGIVRKKVDSFPFPWVYQWMFPPSRCQSAWLMWSEFWIVANLVAANVPLCSFTLHFFYHELRVNFLKRRGPWNRMWKKSKMNFCDSQTYPELALSTSTCTECLFDFHFKQKLSLTLKKKVLGHTYTQHYCPPSNHALMSSCSSALTLTTPSWLLCCSFFRICGFTVLASRSDTKQSLL